MKKPDGIPPTEIVFVERILERAMAERFDRFLFFGTDTPKQKPPKHARKRSPTIQDEKMYQAICMWKAHYEAAYGISSGLKGWIERNIRTLAVWGGFTVLTQILIVIIRAAYGI